MENCEQFVGCSYARFFDSWRNWSRQEWQENFLFHCQVSVAESYYGIRSTHVLLQ